MRRSITQRELRNESGEIMRALDRGDAFTITRNGVPVGVLAPPPRRRFVSADLVSQAFAGQEAIDFVTLRRDLDELVDEAVDLGA